MRRQKINKGISIVAGILAVVGVALLSWYASRPGPMVFASGKFVALSEYKGHPTGVPADFKGDDQISRGRYLTQAADCQACHTVKGGEAFAGGRPFKTPFGTLYSPNITPDAKTGIGQWTDADFLKAVHQGVGPGGKRLYPAFPYAAYTYITDEDVLAMKAYLFSLTPVSSVAPANQLDFPFNQRWLMAFWSILFNPDKRFQPNPVQSVEWNRGAYLTEGLAHCGECHTPRSLPQALDNANKFSGAFAGAWRAYNITADQTTGVGAWSDAELVQYLSTGHAAGRGTASGPMAEAVELSLAQMTPSDIRAMVVYLRSVPAIASKDLPAPKTQMAAASAISDAYAGREARGHRLFAGACVGCHQWTGNNPMSPRASLTGSRAINDPSAVNVAQMVLHGSDTQAEDGKLGMPAFGTAYNDDEVAALVNYVTTRFGARASTMSAADVRKLRQTD